MVDARCKDFVGLYYRHLSPTLLRASSRAASLSSLVSSSTSEVPLTTVEARILLTALGFGWEMEESVFGLVVL